MWKTLLVALATLALASAVCRSGPSINDDETEFDGNNLVITVNGNGAMDTIEFQFVDQSTGVEVSSDCATTVSWERSDATDPDDAACTVYTYTATYLLTTVLGKCGFAVDEDAEEQDIQATYIGRLRVTETDNEGVTVGGVNTPKVYANQLEMQFTFGKNAVASSAATTFAGPAVLLSAVVQRNFTVGDDLSTYYGFATTRIFTSVQAPYKLSSIDTPSESTDFTSGFTYAVSTALNVGACTNSAVDCNQEFTFTVTPKSRSVCKLAGSLTFTAHFTCSDSEFACTSPDPATATITVSFTSDDFCPKLIETLDLSGSTLTIFKDESHSVQASGATGTANTFANIGAVVYLEADFDRPADIAFVSCSLQRAWTKFTYAGDSAGTQNIKIYVNPSLESETTLRGGVELTAGQIDAINFHNPTCTADANGNLVHSPDFQAALAALSFPNNAASGQAIMKVQLDYRVVYQSVSPSQNGAPRTMERTVSIVRPITTLADSSFSAAVLTSPQVAVQPSSSSSSTILGMSQGTVVMAGVAVGAVALIAVVTVGVIRRRRRSATVKKTESTTELVANQA